MAEKRRFLDVWILETNTVYREVPFTVVADWAQQGRLLVDDKLRPSGTAEWLTLGQDPTFSAYLPRSEPYRAEDQAEALEPVQVDFSWKHRSEDEDDDVDMIPLIDVSLVLLIFFMLTANTILESVNIATPDAHYATLASSDPKLVWVGVDIARDRQGNPQHDDEGNLVPVYSFGEGQRGPSEGAGNLTNLDHLLQQLDSHLQNQDGTIEVIVKAHKEMPAGVIRKLQIELQRRPKVLRKYAGVTEQSNP